MRPSGTSFKNRLRCATEHSCLCFPSVLLRSFLTQHHQEAPLTAEDVNNMSNPVDSKSAAGDVGEVEAHHAHIDHSADLDEKAGLSEYKPGAIEAENAENKMGVLEAVRLYPMASFWAFIMSSTIVSFPIALLLGVAAAAN